MLLVEGLEGNHRRAWLMGEYELVDGEAMGGRGVWRKQGGPIEQEYEGVSDTHWLDTYLYYRQGTWTFSDKETMDSRRTGEFAFAFSKALTPDETNGHWRTGPGETSPELQIRKAPQPQPAGWFGGLVSWLAPKHPPRVVTQGGRTWVEY